jgi:hypothetical protein
MSLGKALGSCGFSARMSYPDALLLKILLKPLKSYWQITIEKFLKCKKNYYKFIGLLDPQITFFYKSKNSFQIQETLSNCISEKLSCGAGASSRIVSEVLPTFPAILRQPHIPD